MDSIVQHRVRTRITYVQDTMVAAQAQSDAIKSHMKALEKLGGVEPQKGSADDFVRDFGGGL